VERTTASAVRFRPIPWFREDTGERVGGGGGGGGRDPDAHADATRVRVAQGACRVSRLK